MAAHPLYGYLLGEMVIATTSTALNSAAPKAIAQRARYAIAPPPLEVRCSEVPF
ncbi:hypothetical protein [uncultured Thermosynechococcus sp.]|uniref:hypothetical protein n=1 Tax=uncultured Thermosynechococcus sp. TaxID=436945 RepID=UPI00262C09CA|nr:hypothetical protein [uncultured Thermosynechococcus sp.]